MASACCNTRSGLGRRWVACALLLVAVGLLAVPPRSTAVRLGPDSKTPDSGTVRQRKADGVLYLENGLVQVGVEQASGKIASLRDLRSGRQWLKRPVFPLAVSLADTADIWQATPKSLVWGANSPPVRCSFVEDGNGKAIEVAFNRLGRSGGDVTVAATYRVALDPRSRETRWALALENGSSAVVVQAIFPMLTRLSPLADAELTRPHMAGLRARVSELRGGVLEHFPHYLSMPWFDLGTAQDGLYLASLDQEPRSVWFSFVNSDRHASSLAKNRYTDALANKGWILALGRLPFLAPGAEWTAPPAVVMPHQGGWHAAARAYRGFYQAHYSPIPVSPLLRRLSALSSFHLKTPWGTKAYKRAHGFDAAFDLARSNKYKTRSIGGIRLDGWEEDGYGTFIPGHLPLKELGGAKAFRKMVTKANQRGLRIYPYLNPRLVNVDDALIKSYNPTNVALRERCAVRKVDGTTYTETFAPQGHARSKTTGVVMCPACKPWRDHFEEIALRLIKEVRVPGLYIDQFALGVDNGLLCYNKSHGHATPADVWGPAAVNLAQRLHNAGRARDPNFLIFIEGNFDRLYPYIDLPFSWSDELRFLPKDGSRRAPEVVRYTFDDLAKQKIYSHGTSDGVALALMTANVLDSGGHPLRLIQDRVPDVFYDGHYTDTVGITSAPAGTARVVGFRGAKRFALGVLAEPGRSGKLSINADLAAMNVDFTPTRARVLALSEPADIPVNFKKRGDKLQLEGPMPPAGVPTFVLFE